MAFNSLNDHLVELSQLKSRNPSELPSLCLNTTKLATSLVIIQEEEGAQMSIYYINYVLTRAKLWYPSNGGEKVEPTYFQAHIMQVITNQLLG